MVIAEIFDEVTSIIWNYESYHVCYTYGDEHWEGNDRVTFEVRGHSDQGEGADWTEDWSIDCDGIHTEDGTYKTLEDFMNGDNFKGVVETAIKRIERYVRESDAM